MQVEYSKDRSNFCDAKLRHDDTKPRSMTNKTQRRIRIPRHIWRWLLVTAGVVIVLIIIVVPTVLTVTQSGDDDFAGKSNGIWGNWMSLPCSHSCGGGVYNRVRSCESPDMVTTTTCSGNRTETHPCNTDPCPVHGGWDNWTSFSDCSQTCDGGRKTRYRECDNPRPDYGGRNCSGPEMDTEICNADVCPVNGGWGSWTIVSGCTRSCGGGHQSRVRECDNPYPTYNGKWCPGNATEIQPCNTRPCPDYKSAFTVRRPTHGPVFGAVRFDTTLTNIGNHYNTSTGQYVCEYPGKYIFSFHLYRHPGNNYAECAIRKNTVNKVWAYSNPTDDKGYYESSNSAVLHLHRGDTVDVGSCSRPGSMWEWTSFSGFLLEAD